MTVQKPTVPKDVPLEALACVLLLLLGGSGTVFAGYPDYDPGWTRQDCADYSFHGLYEWYGPSAGYNRGWVDNDRFDTKDVEGCDCSAYVGRCLALPGWAAEDDHTKSHQEVTRRMYSYGLSDKYDIGRTHRVSETDEVAAEMALVQKWDFFVWNPDKNPCHGQTPAGHAGLIKTVLSGSTWTTREALNPTDGIREISRKKQSFIDYCARFWRRNDWGDAPPVIVQPPQSQAVATGNHASFTVTATGALLGYQWRFNGANLSAATGSAYTRSNAQPAHAGNYSVVVTNLGGAVTSAVAVLTVQAPVAITSQPQSQTNYLGSEATFSVSATGAAPLSYQWRFNTTSIPGATAASYTRTNVQFSDMGDYAVVVGNAVGAATSSLATLRVLAPPGENSAPLLAPIGDRTLYAGATLLFTNQAYDPNPTDTLSFSLDPGAPPAACLSQVTGLFSWTPSLDDTNSVHPITIRVTDSGSPRMSATASFLVTVLAPPPPNQAPLLLPIANRSVDAGSLLLFTNLAFDPDGNNLAFSLEAGAPAGATLGPVSGVFSWTPPDADSNTTKTITVRVSDDGLPPLSASASFQVTVLPRLPNHPPVLEAIAEREVHAGTAIVFTNVASDPDGADTLSFSLDEDAPAGAEVDTRTGVFSWTPTDAPGSTTNAITVWVTDDGEPPLSATAVFRLTVRPRPALQNVAISGGEVALSWSAIVGLTYRVEYKPEFASTSWQPLGAPVLASGSVATACDLDFGDNPQRFYRVVVQGK